MASENTKHEDEPPGGAPVSSSNQEGGAVMPVKKIRPSSPVEMTVMKDSKHARKTVNFETTTTSTATTNPSDDVVQNGLSNGHQCIESANTSDDEKPSEKVTRREKSSVSDSPEMKERTGHVPISNGSVIDVEKSVRNEIPVGGVPGDVEGMKKSQQCVDATNTPRDASATDSVQVAPEDRAVAYSPDKRFLKYDIEIGRGSFKTVYKGLDTETGVAVAWCELQENRYNKAEQVRFKEEVAILKTLQHPNILKLYDSWEVPVVRGALRERKVLVLITELMTSGTLKAYMRRMKAIKPKVIRSWGRQILRGLYFLQTRTPPIIHRDLKCDNIFINGTTGLVKIGDLGLATLKRSEVKTVIGTPEFMAPEMYEENYDESVDVYAFGMCLLEMCTQEYPYMECSNPAQIYKRVSQGIKPNAIERVKDPVLRDIIDRSTTVNKKERFTVKHLIDHEFFAEGVKLEAMPQEEGMKSSLFTMRMEQPTSKETSKNKGQETIEFSYDLNADNPESVVDEMVKSGILGNDVSKNVLRSLREYVDDIKQKRQPRKDLAPPEPKANIPIQQQTIPEATEQETMQPKFIRQNSGTEGNATSIVKGTEGGVVCESVPPVVSDPVGVANVEKGRVTPSQLPPVSDQGTNSTKQSELTSPVVQQKPRTLSEPSTNLTAPGPGPTLPVQTVPPLSSNATPSEQTTVSDEKPKTKPPVNQPPVPSEPQLPLSLAPSQSTQIVVEKQGSEGSLSVPSTSALTTETTTPPLQTAHVEDTPGSSTLQVSGVQVDKTSSESTPVHQLEAISSSSLNDAHPTQASASTTDLKVEKLDKDKATVGDSKNGTMKKKSQRAKTKQLKLTFVEVTGEVIKCKLVTSAGNMVNFQFSIKYDKPEVIVLKFVKAGHIAQNEVEVFIQQANRLLTSIAKNRSDSVTKDVVKLEQTEVKQQSETKTQIVPVPVDSKVPPLTESTPSSPSMDSAKSSTSTSSVSLKVSSTEMSASTLSTPSHESQVSVKVVPSSESTTSKTKNGVSQSVSQESRSSHTPEPIITNKQGSPPVTSTKNVSTCTSIVSTQTSVTSPVEEPVTKTVAEVQETAIAVTTTTAVAIPISSQSSIIGFGSTSSTSSMFISSASACPIASTETVAPLPVCIDTQLPLAPMLTRVSKRFEIADVTDEADSPEPSDLSAHSSTENLDKDSYTASTVRSDSNDSNPSPIVQGLAKKFSVQNISSLDCPSDSSIGTGGTEFVMDVNTNSVHSLTPEPGLTALPPPPITTAGVAGYHPPMFGYMYAPAGPQQTNITQRSGSVPFGLAYSRQFPDQYSTSLGLPPSHYRHHEINSETYKPYATMNLPYNATNVPLPEEMSTEVDRTSESVSGQSQQHAHVQRHSSAQESLPSPSEDEHYPTMADVPHAQLLSKAFMRFLYSMSTIFRDPSFKPLMESLDHQFGPTHDQKSSAERIVPQSAPPTFLPKQPDVSEPPAPTLRANTDPGLEIKMESEINTAGESDNELNEVLARLEEEQKLLDQRKQEALAAYHKKKRGSAGNTSSKSESQKSSTDTNLSQLPAQSRRTVSLLEYEVQPSHVQGQSSSIATVSTSNSSRLSLGKDKVDEMEKRIKEQILAEFPSSPLHQQHREDGNTVLNKTAEKRISPTISPLRNERDTQSSSSSVGSQAGRMQELISPPPESRFQKSIVGSHTSLVQLPTSPPPVFRTSRIPHSDSAEWTEYTSASPIMTSPGATTPMSALGSGARYGDIRPGSDISEFDPIISNNHPS